MLKQLARLSVEADGRYATALELQFLKDYLQSLELRVSAYEKIQAAEQEIISKVEAEIRATDPSLFRKGSRDMTPTCRRDRVDVLRYSAAALLSNDLDRLREGFLLWYQTIVRTFKDERAAGLTYKVMQEIVKDYLTPQEAALLCPILELNYILLGK